ncbi:hypothetical protein D3A96_06605 [Robertkochia marina]|nr:hypothetical protein D3A96_06605 [Robertkochia marina]
MTGDLTENTLSEKSIPETSGSKESFDQLEYLIGLKNHVAKRYYPEFAEKQLFQPIAYYTRKGTYVINPNTHIRNNFDHSEAASFDGTEVIKLSEKFTDTVNFQFHVSYSDTDTTALYYMENVLFFQSFELTQKFIPDIKDLNDWSIMVIHELFHGYQREIPPFKEYYTNLEMPGGPDEFLAKYHQEVPWFKKSIYQENEILKSIWIDGVNPQEGLKVYDSLKTIRINRIAKEFDVSIREAEDYEILMEGHARYFESLCKRFLEKYPSDTSMLNDHNRDYFTDMFKNYEVTQDKGLYDLYNDRYYYQLGYNITMILEKHLPEYKKTLYTNHHNFNAYLNILSTKDSE